MVTVSLMPPRPLRTTTEVDDQALSRTREVVRRIARRRLELGLTQTDVARLLEVDPRTVKGWEEVGFPQVKEPSSGLVRDLEAGRLVSYGRSHRALFVGPGVELVHAVEKALGSPKGAFTQDLYWEEQTARPLEDVIQAEPGLDQATKDAMLLLLRAARERAPKRR